MYKLYRLVPDRRLLPERFFLFTVARLEAEDLVSQRVVPAVEIWDDSDDSHTATVTLDASGRVRVEAVDARYAGLVAPSEVAK